jgi:DNA-binding transcriptional LysR family regulator
VNIHHLELFYYVARHGGITKAVRNMPYGIQQPAVSAQVLALESHLGVSLFQRQPFLLTPAGDKLYRFIQPFFQNLDTIADEIRGGGASQVRIGASDVILREHLPGIFQRLGEQFPMTRLTLRSGYQPHLLEWLRNQELDLALTLLDKNLPANFQSIPILKVPLVLLTSRKRKIKSASELWSQKRVTAPLLSLPPNEIICRHFQEELHRRGVEWRPTIELSSLDLIETYVENDYGFGLSVDVPSKRFSRRVKVLPLPDFPPVNFGLVWQGELTPFLKALIQEAQRRAFLLTNRTPEQTPLTPPAPTPRPVKSTRAST